MKDKKPMKTQTTQKTTSGNSIQFGPVNYDQQKHVLNTQARNGKNTIRCSIHEDVFTDLYHCANNKDAFVSSFKQHEREISQALLAKFGNKEWKGEVMLTPQDLG